MLHRNAICCQCGCPTASTGLDAPGERRRGHAGSDCARAGRPGDCRCACQCATSMASIPDRRNGSIPAPPWPPSGPAKAKEAPWCCAASGCLANASQSWPSFTTGCTHVDYRFKHLKVQSPLVDLLNNCAHSSATALHGSRWRAHAIMAPRCATIEPWPLTSACCSATARDAASTTASRH